MTDNRASEEIQKKVNQLTHEKRLLNIRLRTLERENLPNLNTRSQAYRSVQIGGTRDRLSRIDQELEEYRTALRRPKPDRLDRQSQKDLMSRERESDKFKSLEDFINLSQMSESDAFKRQPRLTRSPPATIPEIPQTEDTAAGNGAQLPPNLSTSETQTEIFTSATPINANKRLYSPLLA